MTKFRPVEVLFSPTTDCNLACSHCDIKKSRRVLPRSSAARFLGQCSKAGIKKVGFTGGEPFLAPDFLYTMSREAVKHGLNFDRIMTNGVWWESRKELAEILTHLRDCGYDGSLCVSVDAFHRQNSNKLAWFIRLAVSIWRRPDIISIAYVAGAKETESRQKLSELSSILGGRLKCFGTPHAYIKADDIFVRLFKIDLSPIGEASKLKSPWDGKWFREDKCRGPGNVLFVLPDGDVKPCCGYATGSKSLTIGNIGRDDAGTILKNISRNRFVYTVYNSGLCAVRRRMEKDGVKFPGKTTSHCYFCHYILTAIPRQALNKNLDQI